MTEALAQRRIRVVIVDDHPMVREGTRALLERSAKIEVVGAVGEGMEALRLAGELQPDVLLLDVRLPDISGVEVARQTRQSFPEVKLLVVTGYDEIGYSRALRQLGVHGYLAKSASGAEIIAAVQAVAAGSVLLTAESARVASGGGREPLTSRERDVLELLVAGRRNAEIADQLTVSLKTVEFHVRNVFEKLGARSRAEAVSRALQQGICVPQEMSESR